MEPQQQSGEGGDQYKLAKEKLESWLNRSMKIRMSDGRTLVGSFLCTDRDCNVILGSAQEYLKGTERVKYTREPSSQGEARVLGLAMVPGHHILSIEVETNSRHPPDM